MMKRYILWILSAGVVLLLDGCSDLEDEIRNDIVAYYGKLADQGDHNGTSGGEDENNDTGGSDNEPETEEIERTVSTSEEEPVRKNWYIQLTATDLGNGLAFKGAKLGELDKEGAEENHSLKAFSPFGGAFIDIVFEDPKAVLHGNYALFFLRTDFSSEQRWHFKVRTADSSAEILLQWHGIFVLDAYTDREERQRYREHLVLHHSLWRQMKLIDMETLEEIPAEHDGLLQRYRFHMNGKQERSFEWVVSTEPIGDIPESDTVLYEKAPAASISSLRHTPVKFDLDHPPVIKGNR
jgi:hypothetical protein